jgi:hypothetical protein
MFLLSRYFVSGRITTNLLAGDNLLNSLITSSIALLWVPQSGLLDSLQVLFEQGDPFLLMAEQVSQGREVVVVVVVDDIYL